MEDCGRIINPLLVDEQVRGGIVQGLGGALYEHCIYSPEGQLLVGSMADYLVPMAAEMPDIEVGHVETPTKESLLGAKGAGEAGTAGAPAAVMNAINDALKPFGAKVFAQPFTPERILAALGKVPARWPVAAQRAATPRSSRPYPASLARRRPSKSDGTRDPGLLRPHVRTQVGAIRRQPHCAAVRENCTDPPEDRCNAPPLIAPYGPLGPLEGSIMSEPAPITVQLLPVPALIQIRTGRRATRCRRARSIRTAHVIGLPPAYPFVEERAYTPPAAPPSAYLAMLDATGMTHGVLIQVSAHGTDNRLMLETVRSNRQRLRGIAVAPLGLSDKAYRDMQDAGVVGLRLNVLFGGGIGLERLDGLWRAVPGAGWHLQFLVGTKHLTPIATRLGSCRCRSSSTTWAIVPRPTACRTRFPDAGFAGARWRLGEAVRRLPRHGRRPALSRYHSLGAGTARGCPRSLRLGLRLAARRDLAAQTHAQCRRSARCPGRLGAGRRRPQARAGRQSRAAVWFLASSSRAQLIHCVVMVGLVPTIHRSTSPELRRTEHRDKPEDDIQQESRRMA